MDSKATKQPTEGLINRPFEGTMALRNIDALRNKAREYGEWFKSPKSFCGSSAVEPFFVNPKLQRKWMESKHAFRLLSELEQLQDSAS